MSEMTMSFSLAEEIKLISKVAETPSIYDPDVSKFVSNSKRAEVWEHIAGQLNKRADDCRDLWQKLRRSYVHALKQKQLQLGDPETRTCIHFDLLDSFVKMKQKPEMPVIESCYTVEPSSMDGDTMDGDSSDDPKQNGRKDQLQNVGQDSSQNVGQDSFQNVGEDPLQNGGQDLLQNDGQYVQKGNCGEYVHQDEVGDIVANSSFEGDQGLESTGPGQGQQSLSHQKSDDDEWVDVLVDQGFVEQRRQPRSTTIKSLKQEPRTSSRVKNPLSINGAVDDEVIADILKEEQKILQQYHSSQESGGGGDVRKKKRRKKAPINPRYTKKRRMAAAAKRELLAKNELVPVETLNKYSRGSEGAKPPQSKQSRGNQRSRSSKSDRPQSSRSRKDGGPQSSRSRKDGGPQATKGSSGQSSRTEPQSVKISSGGHSSRSRKDGEPQSMKMSSRSSKGGRPKSAKDSSVQSLMSSESGGENLMTQQDSGVNLRQRTSTRLNSVESHHQQDGLSSVIQRDLRVVVDDLNSSRLLGDQREVVVSRNLQEFDGTSRNLQESDVTPWNLHEFDDIALFSRHISSVLRGLNPLQRAMAKRDLSTVLSHFEILKAKNVSNAASSSNGGPQGFVENGVGWNVVRSSAMESMLSNPALKFIGNQM